MNYPISVRIARLYGCVSFGGIPYRAKTTLKLFVDANEKTKAYSYEISNIEILKGVAGFVTRPSDKTSMLVRILLNGVCDVNGEPLLKRGIFKSYEAGLNYHAAQMSAPTMKRVTGFSKEGI